jgi:hypothetical protein
MAKGKLLGWLNSNPAVMQGVKTAVGGALNSFKDETEMYKKKDVVEDTVTTEPTANKGFMAKDGSMMYLAIGAIVLFMLMKKK